MQTSGASIHIVVGYDFSPLSELALREAAVLAADRDDIAIHVVNARGEAKRHPISDSPGRDVGFKLNEAMRASALLALHDHRAAQGVEVFTHALIGDPAQVIVGMADDVDAEIIIVGTHGRRGIKRLFLGSVAEEVMRAASCPVLVMRPRRRDPRPDLIPEPACPDCLEVREATVGTSWWCQVHDRPWVAPHRYSYQTGGQRPYHPDQG